MDKEKYKKYASERAPSSPCAANCVKAFFCGGAVCVIGEALGDIYRAVGVGENAVKTLIPCTLILAAVILTGFGVFDKMASFAKAGLLVPITGFANAVVSPAIEFKSEGLILGLGAKLFVIAGPVIVYGVAASVIYGIIYFVFS